MKVYYPHYSYSASADDSLFYSGSDGNMHLTKEGAIKEAEEYMNQDKNEFYDYPISYTICEEDVLE